MPDYIVALLPFYRLRNVPQVSLHVPESCIDPEEVPMTLIEEAMRTSEPYGSFLGGQQGVWYDSFIERRLDAIPKKLDELRKTYGSWVSW